MTEIALDEATLWQCNEGHEITDSVVFHGPPGTGKTTTAAATVGKLIQDHEYSLSDVAWVTYRRSLAQDTLQKLAGWDVIDEGQLAEPRKGATRYIGTGHAVANRCADIGEEPVQAWQRAQFCSDRGMEFWTNEPWEDSTGKLLFSVFDYLANQATDPLDTEALHACPRYADLQDEWRGDIVDAWYDWQDYKAQHKIIDFHEMLSRPLENGRSPGRPILVVDEYHDVTGLMDKLFRAWMDDADIVIVAGDPHQVVNAFDGASPEYFDALDLPSVLLPRSFRCPEEHWQIATDLLSNAHEVPAVEVNGHGLVRDYNSPRFEYSSQAGWTSLPGRDTTAGPAQFALNDGDTLLLSRTQMQADGVGAALERAGIPYLSQSDLNGWDSDDGVRRHLFNALQTVSGYTPDHLGYGANAGFSRYSGGQKSALGGDAERERTAIRRALAEHDSCVRPDDVNTWSITIHASKGMEADDVVVYDGISTRTQRDMRSSPESRRNEYRTWYVALSRAKKRLHIMRNAHEWTNSIIPQPLGGVL